MPTKPDLDEALIEDDSFVDDEEWDDEEDSLLRANYDSREAAGAVSRVASFLRPYLKPYRGPFLLLGTGVLMETAYNTAFPLCLKYLIDDALYEEDDEALTWILGVLGVLGISVSVVSVWYERQNAKLSASVLADIRQKLFAHLQKLPMRFYSRARIGEILSRFSNDMSSVEEVVMHGISWGALPLLELVTGIALLFYLNWKLALAALLVIPLTLIGPRLISPRAIQATYQKRRTQASTLAIIQENISAQPVVKAFGLHGIALMWFKLRSGNLREADIRVSFLSAMIERSVNVAVLLLHLLILGFGAYLTFQKQLTIGALVTFESVFWELSYNIGHLTQFIPEVIQAAGSVRHIEELFDEPPFAADSPTAIPAPKFEEDIVFEDVSFSFEGRGMQLKHINLGIPRGKFVAVVGPSGAGKSALLGLLLRLYDPTEGRIALDGNDIRDFSLDSYRSNMAVVFQDNILFNLSLRENIRLGSPGATDLEVERAAREAEIHDFIIRQPDGYETVVGERGSTLSGGQRQRIAIARAILRNPALLILDEATSALDVTTEAAVNRTLMKVSAGRTVVSVTHRLSFVKSADLIHVLDKGRLVESGTHPELIGSSGPYARMWKRQTEAQPDFSNKKNRSTRPKRQID